MFIRMFEFLLYNLSFEAQGRASRRKTIDISFLSKQRNTHIPGLIVSARTFSRPTKIATESCFLK